ncbi:MAG: tetratricopeptide repeat protein [Chloroflexota bacterium]
MSSSIKIKLLGAPAIIVDGQMVTGFISHKANAVVYYVAAQGQTQARETLATLLWTDFGDASAKKNLRNVLSNLRTLLGPHLNITRKTVELLAEPHTSVDAFRLKSLIQNAFHLPSDEPERRTLLAEAVDLYQGELLEGLHLPDAEAFDEWLLMERERFHLLTIQAMNELVVGSIPLGHLGEGIDYATQLLALNSLHEETHANLMLLLALDGQTSAAFTQYRTCKRLLDHEFGSEPSAETEAIYERIKAGEFSKPLHPSQGPSASSSSLASLAHRATEEQATREQGTTLRAINEEAPAVKEANPYRLPLSPGPLIGRSEEVNKICSQLLSPACRMLTLLGPGGIGKTRLAMEAAIQLQGEFEDGVCFVSLAAIDKDRLRLASTIARALGLQTGENQSPEALILAHMADRKVLLVLDNYEHLAGEVELLLQVHCSAPNVTLLLTSRVRLNLIGEVLYPVSGLMLPPADWQPGVAPALLDPGLPTSEKSLLARYTAAELFMSTAQRVQPNFALGQCEAAAVVRICHLVDGIPLALELAAGWIRLLSCTEIATEIESSLDILSSTAPDRPKRHRSLRHLLGYSWRLLTQEEQNSLLRLTVFRGSFDRKAAAQIAQASLPTLAGLMDKSFIQLTDTGRYELHELLRQFASEKLVEVSQAGSSGTGSTGFDSVGHLSPPVLPDSALPDTAPSNTAPPDAESLALTHANFYLDQLREMGDEINGPKANEWLIRLRVDEENIQRAWHYATTAGPLDKLYENVMAAIPFYTVSGRNVEINQILSYAIERLQMQLDLPSLPNMNAQWLEAMALPRSKVEVLLSLLEEKATILNHIGHYHEAIALVQQTIKMAELLGLPHQLIQAYSVWGGALSYLSDPTAYEPLEKALEIARASNLPERESVLLRMLGLYYFKESHFTKSHDFYEQSLALSRRTKNWQEEALTLTSMGWVLERMGEFERAQIMLEHSYGICKQMDFPYGGARALQGLGTLATILGDLYGAAQRHTQAIVVAAKSSESQREAANRYFLGGVYARSGNVAPARSSLEKAIELSREIDDRLTESLSLSQLGYIETGWGSEAEAHLFLEQALAIGVELDNIEAKAAAYQGLGWLHLKAHQPNEASHFFEEEQRLKQQWDQPYATIDAQTGLAQGALAQNNFTEALEICAPLVDFLTAGSLNGVTRLANTFLACHQALLQQSPPKAAQIAQAGQKVLHEMADKFPESHQRELFLHQVPANHALLAIDGG